MNSVVLSGRLTRKPELVNTKSGNSMCTFCIAVRESEEKTHFIECIAFVRLADAIYKNLDKGDKIVVSGNLNQRTYEGKDGTMRTVVEVYVREAEFQLKLVDTPVEEPKTKKAKK